MTAHPFAHVILMQIKYWPFVSSSIDNNQNGLSNGQYHTTISRGKSFSARIARLGCALSGPASVNNVNILRLQGPFHTKPDLLKPQIHIHFLQDCFVVI